MVLAVWILKDLNSHFNFLFLPKRDDKFNIYYLNFFILLNCLPGISFNVFNLLFMPIYYKDPLNCRCEVFRPESSACICLNM